MLHALHGALHGLRGIDMKKEAPNPKGRAGEPVSLHPLSFDDALSGLSQVRMPEREKKKPKAKRKKRARP